MAAEQAALRRRIAEKRQDIAEDLERLNRGLRAEAEAANPINVPRRRPWLALGFALLTGALVGMRFADLVVHPRLPTRISLR